MLQPPPIMPNIPNSWMNDDDFPRFDQQPIQPPQQTQQPNQSDDKKKLPPPLMSLKIDKPGSGEKVDLVLPKALEDALALTTQRIQLDEPIQQNQNSAQDYYDIEDESDEEQGNQANGSKSQSRIDKNKKKKNRKKQNRQKRKELQKENQENQENGRDDTDKQADENADAEKPSRKKDKDASNKDDVEIEYVPERLTVADLAPMYRQFYRVFEIFKLENKPKEAPMPVQTAEEVKAAKKAAEKNAEEEDEFDDGEDRKDDKDRMSKRKMKKLTRLSVAELKQLVNRPDVVEMHDVTARDPKLLVQLKAHRNTVQVPRHWCFKRKYLQGKRGIEKPPFDLPAFIKKTGIMEMRASLQEKDEAKTLKAKMREKIRPKMGKIDIDYQKLHDAFFKWQTKPRMTIHGDLYYEGKEFETRLKEKKPGDLSEELRTSLGMPIGPSCHKIPPPWLIAQQRYGPPPSYPNLKIPGLNAPIPESCSFGYHAGGWGKPPVDESGKPLYGDVFGTSHLDNDVSNAVDVHELLTKILLLHFSGWTRR